MFRDPIMQQSAKAAYSFYLFIIASNLSECKAFVPANPLMTTKTLRFDGGRTVRTPILQPNSFYSPQRRCRIHSEARQIRRARNIFSPRLTLSGEDWSIRSTFRCSCRRKQRTSVLAPHRMSSDQGDVEVVNPLSRDDLERARINDFITILAETPTAEWKPAILDEYLPSLLKGSLYRQTMVERLAKVRSGEEQEALARVDAFLTGYIGQEKRKASRKKVSIILSAATEGATQLDEVVQILAKENLLDSDLKDYLNSLISGEENKCVQSSLLKVLITVRDRIDAELTTESRPEIRTLAQALQVNDPRERKEFLQHAFKKLEDLDEFVKFVEEGIEYMGNDFGVALRSNMPQETFDKMKTIYAEAAAIRRTYLQ